MSIIKVAIDMDEIKNNIEGLISEALDENMYDLINSFIQYCGSKGYMLCIESLKDTYIPITIGATSLVIDQFVEGVIHAN